jgi:hypothetical protein
MGVGWLKPHYGRFAPGITQSPLYRMLFGSQDRPGGVREISFLPGFDPRTVELVTSSHTDYAISAHSVALQCALHP